MAFNYLQPSNQEIFEYPYVVAKDYPNAKQLLSDVTDYDDTLTSTLFELQRLMLHLADKEAKKEQAFIQSYLSTISDKDSALYNELYSKFQWLAYGVDSLSEIIDTIQKYRMNMYDLTKSIKENADNFVQTWEKVYNKVFVNAFNNYDFSHKDLSKFTIEEFVEDVKSHILEEYLATSQSGSQEYDTFLNLLMKQLKNMAQTKFGEDYKKSFELLNNNPYIISKQKEHSLSKNKKSTKVEDIVSGYFFGVVNGLSAEMFLEANKVGKSTARVSQSYKTLTNRKGQGKVAIQTDVLEVLSSDFTISLPNEQELEQKQIETLEELNEWLNKIDLEDKFIIHTSVKDQSTNKNYGTKQSMSIDIRKEATLDARLEPLKAIAEEVSYGKKNIQNLLFALVNAGDYMISNDLYKNGKLVQGLTSICVAYMFEDYIDTFSQLDSNQNNQSLHVYFINGRYYTLSTILRLASAQLNNEKMASKKIVQIGFVPTKKNEFNDPSLNGLQGREKWDKVRENTLNHGKMNVKLNTRALLEAVYGDY